LVVVDGANEVAGDTTERTSGTVEIPGVGSNTISVVVDVFIQHDEGLSIPSQNGDGDMQSKFFCRSPRIRRWHVTLLSDRCDRVQPPTT